MYPEEKRTTERSDEQSNYLPPEYPTPEYYQELATKQTMGNGHVASSTYRSGIAPLPPAQIADYRQPLPGSPAPGMRAYPRMRQHNAFTRWVIAWGGMNRFWLSLGSFVASMVIVSVLYGSLVLGVGLVVLIGIHEFGHIFALRFKKLPATLPIFLGPFGAFVTLPNQVISTSDSAEVAMAGPFLGGLGSLGCLAIFLYQFSTGHGVTSELLVLAGLSFFINLLNLFPGFPFDGGFIARAVTSSRLMPLIGLGVLGLWYVAVDPSVYILGFNFRQMLVFFGILGLMAIMRAFNETSGNVYIKPRSQQIITIRYLLLMAFLAGGFYVTATYHGLFWLLQTLHTFHLL